MLFTLGTLDEAADCLESQRIQFHISLPLLEGVLQRKITSKFAEQSSQGAAENYTLALPGALAMWLLLGGFATQHSLLS